MILPRFKDRAFRGLAQGWVIQLLGEEWNLESRSDPHPWQVLNQ